MDSPRSETPLQTFLPGAGDRLSELFERIDPDFALVWSKHMSRLLARTQLDVRTRFLILTMQYTLTQRFGQLGENLAAAQRAGVPPEELREVILQSFVYAGPWVVAEACQVYEMVFGSIQETNELPSSPAGEKERRLVDERPTWLAEDASDPRLNDLLERYGWRAISTGLRLRPSHHLNMLDTLDALDPDFLQIWLDAVYEGMYSRGVLDDRTRLLCVVGATLAVGETHQSRRHMRAALRVGAGARELLEVIFHTTAFFGHPYVMPAAFDDLIRIADDEGRISELVPADRVDETRRIVAARVARRDGIEDDLGGA